WAFNLDEPALRRTVLEPWIGGVALRIGDREWDPRASTLRVLEGERLAPADLAHGQGWNRALRTGGRDVARELLAAAEARALAMTVVAAGAAGRDAGVALLGELAAAVVDWTAVRAALLAGERAALPVQAALVVAERAASPRWHLDAGLAIGALGPRAVLVALAGDAPTPIAGLPAPLQLRGAAAPIVLAERLRDVGCAVRSRERSA
ncbi:MAG: hypothetical protein QOJ35_3134, partial [Solirubrobacteraceae bacterium]|nr:hypothetical protein [Solirubrobacteraceae bacterium]